MWRLSRAYSSYVRPWLSLCPHPLARERAEAPRGWLCAPRHQGQPGADGGVAHSHFEGSTTHTPKERDTEPLSYMSLMKGGRRVSKQSNVEKLLPGGAEEQLSRADSQRVAPALPRSPLGPAPADAAALAGPKAASLVGARVFACGSGSSQADRLTDSLGGDSGAPGRRPRRPS